MAPAAPNPNQSPFSEAEWALIAQVCRTYQARSKLWHAEAMAAVVAALGRHPGYNALYRRGLVPRHTRGREVPRASYPRPYLHRAAADVAPRTHRPAPIRRAVNRALRDLEALCGPTRTAWTPELRRAAEANGPLRATDPVPEYVALAAALVRGVEAGLADRLRVSSGRTRTDRGTRYTGPQGAGVRYKLVRRGAHHTLAS